MSALAVLNLSLDNSDVSSKAKETEGIFARLGSAIERAFVAKEGVGDANEALGNMQSSLVAANNAATPLSATMSRLEATLHGAAAVARVATTAIALLPKVFHDIPPAVTRTLNSVSLASRAISVLRGELTPLSGALGYLELRNLGVRRSYAALAATMGVATSMVVRAGRSINNSVGAISRGGSRAFGGVAGLVSSLAVGTMGLAGPLVAGAGAAGLAAVAFAGLKKAFDLGGELTDLTARTGIAVQDLVVMRQAFVNAGKGADDVGPAVARMQKALAGVNEEGQPTNAIFEALHLNMAALREMSPAQQFSTTAKALAAIPDPAQRAAAAMGIFGKSGAELLSVFTDSNAFGDAAKQVGAQAGLLQRDAALFDKISDTLGTVGTKVQGFFVGAADKLAPVLEPIMDWFAGVDLAGLGQRAGAAVAGVVGALTNGSLWDAVGASLIAVVQHTLNEAWANLRGIVGAVGAYIGETIKNALTLFSIVTRGSFWAGVGNALMAAAGSFNAMLLDGVASLLDKLRRVPGIGGKVGAASDYARAEAEKQRQFAASDGAASADQLTPAFDEFKSRLVDAGTSVAAAFEQARDAAGDLIDSRNNDTVLSDAFDRLKATFADAAKVKTVGDSARKKTPFDLELAKDSAGREPAKASRLFAVSGFGLFVKDPLAQASRAQLAETRKQTGLLEKVVANTSRQPVRSFEPMKFY
jgi:hypothetical protein